MVSVVVRVWPWRARNRRVSDKVEVCWKTLEARPYRDLFEQTRPVDKLGRHIMTVVPRPEEWLHAEVPGVGPWGRVFR